MRQTKTLPSPKKTQTSPKKQPAKSTSMLPDSYLEILGSIEPTTQLQNEITEEDDDVAQLILDKQKTLARAMKAATDGDAEGASYLFRLHSKMVIHPPVLRSIPPPMIETKAAKSNLIDDESKIEDEKPFVENGITFVPGTYL